LGLAGYATSVIKTNGLNSKIELTQNVALAAKTIAKEFNDRASKGEMDLEVAQNMAKTAIRSMRYGDGEYLFAYDDKANSIIHGVKPEREGKNFIDSKDENGYVYLPDLIKKAKAGGGHIFYMFPHAGSTVSVPKVSSAVYFEPWNWVIGTGVYIDDIDEEFWQNIRKFALLFGAVLVVISGVAIVLARAIATPIEELAGVTQRIGRGDYDLTVPALKRRDEIGVLAVAIDTLKTEAHAAETLRHEQTEAKRRAEEDRARSMVNLSNQFESSVMDVVNTITTGVATTDGAATSLSHAATKVRNEASDVAGAAEEVDANIQTISAATEELTASISEIASQVTHSTQVTRDVVRKTEETDQMVKELAEAVERISGVVVLINDIAAQTNLLALNATIEAARAGDAGKGFAVVANEVKNLASQTSKATDEIIGQIEAVKTATSRSVEALHQVTAVIGTVMEISNAIAAAVEEQTAATKEISSTINQAASGTKMVAGFIVNMADLTTKVDGEARTVSETSSDLKLQTQTLNTEVGGFLRTIRG